jgi:serine/threonine protein kinase
MGVVYRVRDRVTGQLQAMKRVSASGSRQAVDAFELEYHVLASLDHPRIIRVYDYGVDLSGPYYTMELLEGQDMRRAAPLLFRRACLYLRDVATSLALLHGRRLLHRDLSPSNVRLTPDGHCKPLDFGALAPFGVSSNVVGTPPLIAPEALNGGSLDQRTDLYALGALAYWMLTGRHAYPARAVAELPDTWADPLVPPSVYDAA